MIIMAVDYGDARTGLAVCGASELLASPFEVIHQPNANKLIEAVTAAAQEKGVQKFVVGCPFNMDASAGERAQKCAAFARKLAEHSGIPAALWDERLTTTSAHAALNVTDTRGKKRKQVVDAVAAVMILEGYLAYRKTHTEDPVYPALQGSLD